MIYMMVLSMFLVGGSFDGICPICKEQGIKSKVYPGGCTSTLIACGNGHYDEEGKYHPADDCNMTTCNFRCSNGHEFSRSNKDR